MRECIRFMKRLPKKALCIVLVFALIFQMTGFVSAAEKIIYIEDIQLCTANSTKEAAAFFDKIGYTMLNADLNADTGTGKYVYLGYKTTEDRTKAITDIKMMPMDGGYQTYDYDELIAYMASQSSATAATLKKAADGFVDQFKAGSPRAYDAWLGLNMFRVGSADMQFGDFILAGKANQDFFVEFISKSSSAAVHAVSNFLSIGLSQYNNDRDDDGNVSTTGWAGMVASSYLWELYEKGLSTDDRAELDRTYEDTAKALFKDIQLFTTNYENALTRYENNHDTYTMSVQIDSIEDGVEKLEEMTFEDADISYLTAFELLNSFDFDENTKMGDWFLDIGRKTSETVDLKVLYPVIESMGPGMASLVSVTGFLSAVWNLGDNTASTEFEEAVAKFKKDFGDEGVELMINMDEEFKGKTFGYTSEAIRKKGAENLPGLILDRANEKSAKWQQGLKEISLYVGIATTCIAGVIFLAKVGVAITASALGTAAATSSIYGFFTSCAAGATAWMSVAGYIGIGILVVGLAIALSVYLFTSYSQENKADFQSKKPDYFFDAITNDGVDSFALYKSATDYSNENQLDITGKITNFFTDDLGGPVGDLNAGKQWRWVILCFTKDPFIGSPLRLDENGECFRVVYGNLSPLDGYDSVKYFDERSAGDMNAHCEKNGVRGIYMHYTTEASIASRASVPINAPDETEKDSGEETEEDPVEEKSYILDVIIGIGKTAMEAKSKITAHKDRYYILDVNLSPDQGQFTYLGYRLTADPAAAITDLRVAPYSAGGSKTILYGDVIYTYIDILGYDKGKGSELNTPLADALYYTKDASAGSPIEVDGFHPCSKYDDVDNAVKNGWEPISYFGCDVPYDFNTKYEQKGSTYVTDHGHNGGTNVLNSHTYVWLYYEPSKKYTSGEKYLSGMYFAGGYDILDTPEDGSFPEYINSSDPTWYVLSLFCAFTDMNPRFAIATDTNLANGVSGEYVHAIDDFSHKEILTHGNTQLYFLYTWTYNPKRAISNMTILQGDSFTNFLPYTVSKSDGAATYNYVAAINEQQQFDPGLDKIMRFVSPTNTYMNSTATALDGSMYASRMLQCSTDTKPSGIKFGYSRMHFLPTELYISGPTKDVQPLTLDDVIVVTDASKVKKTVNDTKVNYTVSGKTLGGNNPAANKSFRPVTEMKDPNSQELFNLAYPTSLKATKPVYLIIRGQQQTRKKYIGSISVGAFSRQQYQNSNPKASENDLKAVDAIVNMQAIVGAASGCVDETIVYNAALANQNNAWYNRQSGGVGYTVAPENSPAAYLGVTRTDSAEGAVKGVILYQSPLDQASETVEIDGVTYICGGTTSPIYIGNDKYYLYYTRNTGATPGAPITNITVDDVPLVSGSATNLCGKTGDANNLFGNPNQPAFIHLVYDSKEAEFYNKVYIGKGSYERAAMCDLLSQGCVEYVKADLNNKADGDTILFGYRTGCHDWAEIEKKKGSSRESEIARQESEIVYDIIVTSDEPYHPEGVVSKNVYYTPVSSVNLNSGCPLGAELYMYYASSYYSERYNKNTHSATLMPNTLFTGWITKVAFAENERVPYTALLEKDENWTSRRAAAEETGGVEDYYAWEYVLESGDTMPVDLNEGAVTCNGAYCGETRLYMFARRSDGSVKGAGEITGGYVESTYPIGDVYIRK